MRSEDDIRQVGFPLQRAQVQFGERLAHLESRSSEKPHESGTICATEGGTDASVSCGVFNEPLFAPAANVTDRPLLYVVSGEYPAA
jgi:hypothetical protein